MKKNTVFMLLKTTAKALFCYIAILYAREALAFESFVVKNINVTGLAKVSEEVVLSSLPIKTGQALTRDKTQDFIVSLYELGLFSDITLHRQQNSLLIAVVENPVISKLSVLSGKDKVPKEVQKILTELDIKNAHIYNPTKVALAEKKIYEHYLAQRNFNIKVATKVDYIDNGSVEIAMQIKQGPIPKVKEISFSGNNAFSNDELFKVMLHKTNDWLELFRKSSYYSREKLIADVEQIKELYHNNGYLNVKVLPPRISLGNNIENVYVSIEIQEGNKYSIGDIVLTNDKVLAEEKLQQIVDDFVKSGDVYSRKQIVAMQTALENQFNDNGYSKSQVQIAYQTQDDKINLTINTIANARILLRKLYFTGNNITQDRVIRNYFEQYEYSWLSNRKIKQAEHGLQRAGIASKLEVKTEPVIDQEDMVDMYIGVSEEQRFATLMPSISYAYGMGVSFDFNADAKNFAGTGKDIGLNINYTKNMYDYRFSYADPFFSSAGIGMAYELYMNKERQSSSDDFLKKQIGNSFENKLFNHSVNSRGANVTWMFRLSPYNRFNVGFSYDNSKVYHPAVGVPAEVQYFDSIYPRNTFSEVGFNFSFSHDSLNHVLFPTKGWNNSFDCNIILPGSTIKRYMLGGQVNWYHQLIKNLVVNKKFTFGYANTYADKGVYPYFRNYRLGGLSSVRGFEQGSLGPLSSTNQPIGGNLLFCGRIQAIFPLPFIKNKESTRINTFIDYGQLYSTLAKHNPQGVRMSKNPAGLRASAGVALMWDTPLGVPVMLGVAFPIKKKSCDCMDKWVISLGMF